MELLSFFLIYLLGYNLVPPLWGPPASTSRKETRRKDKWKEWRKGNGSRHRRRKQPISSRVIDALIGDEEQNGKQKKEQKERNRDRAPTELHWTILLPFSTRMDHTVDLSWNSLPAVGYIKTDDKLQLPFSDKKKRKERILLVGKRLTYSNQWNFLLMQWPKVI